jgi:hypothetical protein
MGKTKLCEMQDKFKLRISDSDSSLFSWTSPGVRNPDFPHNYIDHIAGLLRSKDIICISSHKAVRDALRERHLFYQIVYPDRAKTDKSTYIERLRARSGDAFAKTISDNWDKWIDEIEAETFPAKYPIDATSMYLSDWFEEVTKVQQIV